MTVWCMCELREGRAGFWRGQGTLRRYCRMNVGNTYGGASDSHLTSPQCSIPAPLSAGFRAAEVLHSMVDYKDTRLLEQKSPYGNKNIIPVS